MIVTKLNLKDFEKYFNKNKLNNLLLPNKPNIDALDIKDCSLKIDLHWLYKEITKWKIKGQDIKTNDIVAVIVFGSSVRYPNEGFYEYIKERKKYVIFGQVVKEKKRKPKKVRDIDVLVITKQDMSDEKVIKPIIGEYLTS